MHELLTLTNLELKYLIKIQIQHKNCLFARLLVTHNDTHLMKSLMQYKQQTQQRQIIISKIPKIRRLPILGPAQTCLKIEPEGGPKGHLELWRPAA